MGILKVLKGLTDAGYTPHSQLHQVDMSRFDDSKEGRAKKIDMIVRLAWMEAGGLYGFTSDKRKKLEENFLKGKQVYEEVTFASYLLDGCSKWSIKYCHKTKALDEKSWREWYELSEKERDNWYPVVQWGLKSETSGRDILNMVYDWNETDGRQFATKFHEAFWDMAGVFLGMKLDKDKKIAQLTVPKYKNGAIPETIIGIPGVDKGPEMVIKINFSAKRLEKLSPEQLNELLVAVGQLKKQIDKATKGLSRFVLSREGDQAPAGPKKTDYDLLKEAFDWVEKNTADCREGYAKDGKAMIERMQQQEKTIPALVASMELTGDYEAVLARYQELKKQPESDKKDKGDGKGNKDGDDKGKDDSDGKGSKGKDGGKDNGKGDKGSDKPGLAKAYQDLQDKHGEHASAQTSAGWGSILAGLPEFEDARKEDGPLSHLAYRRYTIFEIAVEYISHTGKPLPKWLATLCDAEVRRIEAEYGKADDSDNSDESDGE